MLLSTQPFYKTSMCHTNAITVSAFYYSLNQAMTESACNLLCTAGSTQNVHLRARELQIQFGAEAGEPEQNTDAELSGRVQFTNQTCHGHVCFAVAPAFED